MQLALAVAWLYILTTANRHAFTAHKLHSLTAVSGTKSVEVTLQQTFSRPVSCCQAPSGVHEQIFITVRKLRVCWALLLSKFSNCPVLIAARPEMCIIIIFLLHPVLHIISFDDSFYGHSHENWKLGNSSFLRVGRETAIICTLVVTRRVGRAVLLSFLQFSGQLQMSVGMITAVYMVH